MRAIPAMLLLLVLTACARPHDDVRDAAPSDAGRACGLPIQLEIDLAAQGSCGAPPTVMLVLDGAGAVTSVSARVARGVTVPSIPCAFEPPTITAGACAWPLSLHCAGSNGERLDLEGTLTGTNDTWTSSSVTATLTGLPPRRLTCASTASATTR